MIHCKYIFGNLEERVGLMLELKALFNFTLCDKEPVIH